MSASVRRSPRRNRPRGGGCQWRLRVVTQTQFLNSIFWRAAYGLRAGIVCFNLPFDISRIAYRAGEARNKSNQPAVVDGGFSFLLWPYEDHGTQKQSHYRPSIAIKSIDSKRAFKRFKGPDRIDFVDRIPEGDHEPVEDWKFQGNFLDLRTLTFALTDRSHSLQSACNAFGRPYTKRDGCTARSPPSTCSTAATMSRRRPNYAKRRSTSSCATP